jgi:ribosomal protein S15P/S13E
MPINDDGVVFMTRQDWITKRSRLYNRLVQLNMARVYLEEQLDDYKIIARELKSVNQQIRNTTFKINNLNRHLGD